MDNLAEHYGTVRFPLNLHLFHHIVEDLCRVGTLCDPDPRVLEH